MNTSRLCLIIICLLALFSLAFTTDLNELSEAQFQSYVFWGIIALAIWFVVGIILLPVNTDLAFGWWYFGLQILRLILLLLTLGKVDLGGGRSGGGGGSARRGG